MKQPLNWQLKAQEARHMKRVIMSDRNFIPELTKYLTCYKLLNKSMTEQSFLVLRNEFIHLNYCFFLEIFEMLVRIIIKVKNQPIFKKYFEFAKKLKTKQNDFNQMREYKINIRFLFNHFFKNGELSGWNNDPKVEQILKKKEVVLSTFAYETLFTMLKQKNFQELKNVIMKNKIKISYADSQKKEAYLAQELFNRDLRLEDIDQTNQANYVTGMSRDLYNFISKLEDIFQKKQSFLVDKMKKDIPVFPREELFDPKAKFPIEKSSDTFLSHCPEYKNKFLVDFGKAYLNRRIVDKENDPSILRLDLGDSDFKVSVVEVNVVLKVLLLGYLSGKIRIVLLYKVQVNSGQQIRPRLGGRPQIWRLRQAGQSRHQSNRQLR